MEVIEIIDSEDDFKTPKVKQKRCSSFFNILTASESSKLYSGEINPEDYEKSLEKERNDWVKLIKDTSNRVKFKVNSKVVLEPSILSAERREYIEQAINIPDFLKQHDAFCDRANFYIRRKEWATIKYNNCKNRLDDAITDLAIEMLPQAFAPPHQTKKPPTHPHPCEF